MPEFFVNPTSTKFYAEMPITGFEYRPLPEEALKIFKESNKDMICFEGIVYQKDREHRKVQTYTGSEDITEIVKPIIDLEEVQSTLSKLETLTGKNISTTDLVSLPGFRGFYRLGYGDISLHFTQSEKKGDVYTTYLQLSGGFKGGINIKMPAILETLAEMQYSEHKNLVDVIFG